MIKDDVKLSFLQKALELFSRKGMLVPSRKKLKTYAGRTADRSSNRKTTGKNNLSGQMDLPNGTTVGYTIDNGVLGWIVLTDKSGNSIEVPPRFFDVSLLKPALGFIPKVN
jgi:hypothetical protein